MKKVKDSGSQLPNGLKRGEHNRQILSALLEIELAKYLLRCSFMSRGLTPTQTRKLVFDFAKANNVKCRTTGFQAKTSLTRLVYGIPEKTPVVIHPCSRTSKSKSRKWFQQACFLTNFSITLVRFLDDTIFLATGSGTPMSVEYQLL